MSDLILPSVPGAIYSRGTAMYREIVQEGESGVEYRTKKWTRPRYRHEITFKARRTTTYDEAQSIASFLCHHGARHESFLFLDPWDSSVTAHGFGVGDGSSTKFPLQRTLGGSYTDRLGTWDVYTTPRTNLLLRSQELDNGAWGNGGSTGACTPNTAIAPDGTLTADAISLPADSDYWGQSVAMAPAIGSLWTFSLWVKGTAGQTVNLSLQTGGGTWEGAGTGVTMTGACQRATVTLTVANGSHTSLYPLVQRTPGQTATSFYAWGAQLESGSIATAYIPTTSAAVTSYPAWWTANQSTGALVAPATSSSFEPVTEPDWSAVTIYKAGVAQVPGTDFTFTAAGIVTFTSAPADEASLTWTGTYHKRVRFDEDEPSFDRIATDVLQGGTIELVSVI